jgi:hypothetical protein
LAPKPVVFTTIITSEKLSADYYHYYQGPVIIKQNDKAMRSPRRCESANGVISFFNNRISRGVAKQQCGGTARAATTAAKSPV